MSFSGKIELTIRCLAFVFLVVFQVQVPNWVPLSKDVVVILSGIVEFGLSTCIIFWQQERVVVGIILAVFYVLVFPGNIAQYVNGVSAFGLDTDKARLIRLFFQPVLILWPLWSTGALKSIQNLFTKHS